MGIFQPWRADTDTYVLIIAFWSPRKSEEAWYYGLGNLIGYMICPSSTQVSLIVKILPIFYHKYWYNFSEASSGQYHLYNVHQPDNGIWMFDFSLTQNGWKLPWEYTPRVQPLSWPDDAHSSCSRLQTPTVHSLSPFNILCSLKSFLTTSTKEIIARCESK